MKYVELIQLYRDLSGMFFELQDIKRRHNPAWWTNNVTGWTTAVDSTWTWNFQRGAIIGMIAGPMQQYITHFINHASAMLKQYEPPVGVTQWRTFLRETRNLESFTSGLKSRWQIGLLTGGLHISSQIALTRQFNSGWSSIAGGFQYSYFRKVPTFLMATILSSPIGVAIDMASRAYYSDRTFPRELQKGYKSFFDALRRIPFEEGPHYLFRNSFPLFIKHSMGPFTLFYCYDLTIDKLSFMWRVGTYPVLPVILFTCLFSTYLAAAFTYPFAYSVREMVDFWPKKNGIDPFKGNYRLASTYVWFSQTLIGFYPGFFKNYFWHIAPQWFVTCLLAEKFGIFKYWRMDIFNGPGDNSPQDSFV